VTVSQKASLSLLISVFLFAAFAVVSFWGLFDLVETRFYNPSITKKVSGELAQETLMIQNFINELDDQFSETLQNEAVKRSFLPNQSADDIFERSRIFGSLTESLGGLQSVRFVDVTGRRIHYSTLETDIFSQDQLSISYRNYNEETESFLYRDISVSNLENTKLTLDSSQNRILFSLPFYDSYNNFRGTAIFSLSVRAISDRLLGERLIRYGEDVSIVSSPGGVLIGMPKTGAKILGNNSLMNAVTVIWNEGIMTLSSLDSGSGELSFALISGKTEQGIFIGKIVDESLFEFSFAMKIILLASFFLTVYLIVFLLFNLRQDPMMVIQNKLKRLQTSIFQEYYEQKGRMDWAKWIDELEYRREEVRNELKRGIKLNPSSYKAFEIDTLIDKSWDNMASVMSLQGQPEDTAADIEELVEVKPIDKSDKIEELEEIESVNDEEVLEELEELDDAEEILEELDEAESFDDEDEIYRVASEIEFADAETAENAEDIDASSLEIYSPFDTIHVNDDTAEDESNADNSSSLEEVNPSYNMSLVYKPFQAEMLNADISELEQVDSDEEVEPNGKELEIPVSESVSDDVIIEERDGVNYIRDFNINASVKSVDLGFKELVDSVLQKKDE
jgi:hypothetical protein